jgi:hypothetical protein
MLVTDSRTSLANGALGRHEQHDSGGMSLLNKLLPDLSVTQLTVDADGPLAITESD